MPKQPSGESCISMRQSDAVWFHPAEVDSWTAGSISHSSKTAIIGVLPPPPLRDAPCDFQFTTSFLCLLSFACAFDAYVKKSLVARRRGNRQDPGGDFRLFVQSSGFGGGRPPGSWRNGQEIARTTGTKPRLLGHPLEGETQRRAALLPSARDG